MAGRKLIWQLFPSYVGIVILSLLVVGWYALSTVRDFSDRNMSRDVRIRTALIAREAAQELDAADGRQGLVALCRRMADEARMRVTIVAPSGEPIADSAQAPATIGNLADAPEVASALLGTQSEQRRFDPQQGETILHNAAPVMSDGSVEAVVRVSVPMSAAREDLAAAYWRILLGGILVAAIGGGLGLLLSRRISRPLENLQKGVEHLSDGDLTNRLPAPRTAEMAALADTINHMARQMNERIGTIVRQRNEQEAVLASMLEGVLALDNEERILSLNPAASRLLEIDPTEAGGRNIREMLRNPDLNQFVEKVSSSQESVEGEITMQNGKEKRYLQAHGTVLRDPNNRNIGILLVLNDVTRIRKLETMRRDFVANVSHELKTPITSIKGFVETLLDGAMESREELDRFLAIIARHADRLNAILEDLLALSRIEQGTGDAEIAFQQQYIQDILISAVECCKEAAAAKDMEVEVRCSEDLKAFVTPTLLEQAVINLLDNAIKYSPAGKRVTVGAVRKDGEIHISVSDEGPGISKEHLSRLFERFYRVDKARSRQLGGTGLGLSIVKHIAQMHGGGVIVESKRGRGSVFTIHIPARRNRTGESLQAVETSSE